MLVPFTLGVLVVSRCDWLAGNPLTSLQYVGASFSNFYDTVQINATVRITRVKNIRNVFVKPAKRHTPLPQSCVALLRSVLAPATSSKALRTSSSY